MFNVLCFGSNVLDIIYQVVDVLAAQLDVVLLEEILNSVRDFHTCV